MLLASMFGKDHMNSYDPCWHCCGGGSFVTAFAKTFGKLTDANLHFRPIRILQTVIATVGSHVHGTTPNIRLEDRGRIVADATSLCLGWIRGPTAIQGSHRKIQGKQGTKPCCSTRQHSRFPSYVEGSLVLLWKGKKLRRCDLFSGNKPVSGLTEIWLLL